ncbi:DNA-directed DNA polymerase [Malassezia sp. CBS 17886]|nr:DNA-directed DNA polymerase [Malassezia sp. CBS 17886]
MDASGGASGVAPAAVPADVRRMILRSFTKKHHLQLRSDAVSFVYTTLQAHGLLADAASAAEAVDVLVNALIEQHVAGLHAGGDEMVVTSAALQKVYDQLLVESADAQHGESASAARVTHGEQPALEKYFSVCDAFRQPRIVFHPLRKVFERAERPPSLLAHASAPSEHMTERYELLRSIVQRNEHFLPPLPMGASLAERQSFMKLTTTKNLLGRQGERCLLFGRLSTMPDGQYALEDTEGIVAMDLSRAVAGEGIFTEGCFVLVEGEYMANETVYAYALGHPPSETRDAARELFGHMDFTGAGAVPAKNVTALRAQETQHADLCIAVFSDVHLDHAKPRANLRAILQGYDDADFIPFALVLCGNFCADAPDGRGVHTARFRDAFQHLADLLVAFPRILERSHLVIVPGPGDPVASHVLPRARLPAPLVDAFERRLPRAFVRERLHWTSNPCRLVFFSQELVVFREDAMSKMLRNAVRLKDEINEGDLQKFLVSTLLDQAHLCPLPHQVRPVLWEYAHALRLYPMPSALVLADRYERFELTYEGCHVFNPGSFRGSSYGWTTYYPATGQAERSELAGG